MMDDTYREAFAEVLEVIKHSTNSIKEKIPKKFINFLIENKDNNYLVKIDFNKENWDEYIKDETQGILALIYRDYIVSKEKRQVLLREEKKEQIKIENELSEKYNINNLFSKKKTNTTVLTEENSNITLINYKESFIKRIWNKIKTLLKR